MPGYNTQEEAESLLRRIMSEDRVPRVIGFEMIIAFNAWLKETGLLIDPDKEKQISELLAFEPYRKYFPDWALSQPDIGVRDSKGEFTGLPEVLLLAEHHIDMLTENRSDDEETVELLRKKQLLREKLRKNGWEY